MNVTNKRRLAAVVALRLTARVAEQRIRIAAVESGNVKWSRHALDRMVERDFVDADVLRTLRSGTIAGDPEEAEGDGEWKCKMINSIRGGRDAGVVVVILRDGKLFVKTVEWEDLS
jgi:hypothetical protein